MPIGNGEILNRWGYHPSTELTAAQHEQVREAYIAFAEFLNQLLPDGRPKSTAFTKLQESSMWANFSVAEQAPVEAPRPTRPLMASPPVPKPPTKSNSFLRQG